MYVVLWMVDMYVCLGVLGVRGVCVCVCVCEVGWCLSVCVVLVWVMWCGCCVGFLYRVWAVGVVCGGVGVVSVLL